MTPLSRAFLLLFLTGSLLTAAELPVGCVTFNRPNGPYTPDMTGVDFGNGAAVSTRRFMDIQDQSLNIRFVAGRKVDGTGLGFTARLPPQQQYTLAYRIKYDAQFETGLHGKQFGLSGGRGYTGGLGRDCRENGDGWSVRLQFDAHRDGISNQLYVYHCGMTGKYGEGLGTGSKRFLFTRGQWHEIRMTITMQTRPDSSDGRIEVWCDGVKKFDLPQVRFVTKEAGRNVNRLRMESFPGGGGLVPTRDSYLRVDDVRWFGPTPAPAEQGSVIPTPPRRVSVVDDVAR
jgi:hypothetical protein